VEAGVGLAARAAQNQDGSLELSIRCSKFAQSVHVEAPGYVADDQYFHMAPDSGRVLRLQPRAPRGPERPAGSVHALNADAPCRMVMTQ
jgi:beta-mannosidase